MLAVKSYPSILSVSLEMWLSRVIPQAIYTPDILKLRGKEGILLAVQATFHSVADQKRGVDETNHSSILTELN